MISDIEKLCFKTLDEEGKIPKGSSKTWYEKMKRTGPTPGNSRNSPGKPSAAAEAAAALNILYPPTKTVFTVKHYAGHVDYQPDLFMEKNVETLNKDLVGLMCSSGNSLIQALFKDDSSELEAASATATAPTSPAAGGKRGGSNNTRSISWHFQSQLQTLISVLRSTQSHFIRCVKSNDACQPLVFQNALVQQQLLYSGVFEVVRIQQSGLPIRLPNEQFLARFRCLVPAPARFKCTNAAMLVSALQNGAFEAADGEQKLLGFVVFALPSIKVGNTRTFYTGVEKTAVESARTLLLDTASRRLQQWLKVRVLTRSVGAFCRASQAYLTAVAGVDGAGSSTAFSPTACVTSATAECTVLAEISDRFSRMCAPAASVTLDVEHRPPQVEIILLSGVFGPRSRSFDADLADTRLKCALLVDVEPFVKAQGQEYELRLPVVGTGEGEATAEEADKFVTGAQALVDRGKAIPVHPAPGPEPRSAPGSEVSPSFSVTHPLLVACAAQCASYYQAQKVVAEFRAEFERSTHGGATGDNDSSEKGDENMEVPSDEYIQSYVETTPFEAISANLCALDSFSKVIPNASAIGAKIREFYDELRRSIDAFIASATAAIRTDITVLCQYSLEKGLNPSADAIPSMFDILYAYKMAPLVSLGGPTDCLVPVSPDCVATIPRAAETEAAGSRGMAELVKATDASAISSSSTCVQLLATLELLVRLHGIVCTHSVQDVSVATADEVSSLLQTPIGGDITDTSGAAGPQEDCFSLESMTAVAQEEPWRALCACQASEFASWVAVTRRAAGYSAKVSALGGAGSVFADSLFGPGAVLRSLDVDSLGAVSVDTVSAAVTYWRDDAGGSPSESAAAAVVAPTAGMAVYFALCDLTVALRRAFMSRQWTELRTLLTPTPEVSDGSSDSGVLDVPLRVLQCRISTSLRLSGVAPTQIAVLSARLADHFAAGAGACSDGTRHGGALYTELGACLWHLDTVLPLHQDIFGSGGALRATGFFAMLRALDLSPDSGAASEALQEDITLLNMLVSKHSLSKASPQPEDGNSSAFLSSMHDLLVELLGLKEAAMAALFPADASLDPGANLEARALAVYALVAALQSDPLAQSRLLAGGDVKLAYVGGDEELDNQQEKDQERVQAALKQFLLVHGAAVDAAGDASALHALASPKSVSISVALALTDSDPAASSSIAGARYSLGRDSVDVLCRCELFFLCFALFMRRLAVELDVRASVLVRCVGTRTDTDAQLSAIAAARVCAELQHHVLLGVISAVHLAGRPVSSIDDCSAAEAKGVVGEFQKRYIVTCGVILTVLVPVLTDRVDARVALAGSLSASEQHALSVRVFANTSAAAVFGDVAEGALGGSDGPVYVERCREYFASLLQTVNDYTHKYNRFFSSPDSARSTDTVSVLLLRCCDELKAELCRRVLACAYFGVAAATVVQGSVGALQCCVRPTAAASLGALNADYSVLVPSTADSDVDAAVLTTLHGHAELISGLRAAAERYLLAWNPVGDNGAAAGGALLAAYRTYGCSDNGGDNKGSSDTSTTGALLMCDAELRALIDRFDALPPSDGAVAVMVMEVALVREELCFRRQVSNLLLHVETFQGVLTGKTVESTAAAIEKATRDSFGSNGNGVSADIRAALTAAHAAVDAYRAHIDCSGGVVDTLCDIAALLLSVNSAEGGSLALPLPELLPLAPAFSLVGLGVIFAYLYAYTTLEQQRNQLVAQVTTLLKVLHGSGGDVTVTATASASKAAKANKQLFMLLRRYTQTHQSTGREVDTLLAGNGGSDPHNPVSFAVADNAFTDLILVLRQFSSLVSAVAVAHRGDCSAAAGDAAAALEAYSVQHGAHPAVAVVLNQAKEYCVSSASSSAQGKASGYTRLLSQAGCASLYTGYNSQYGAQTPENGPTQTPLGGVAATDATGVDAADNSGGGARGVTAAVFTLTSGTSRAMDRALAEQVGARLGNAAAADAGGLVDGDIARFGALVPDYIASLAALIDCCTTPVLQYNIPGGAAATATSFGSLSVDTACWGRQRELLSTARSAVGRLAGLGISGSSGGDDAGLGSEAGISQCPEVVVLITEFHRVVECANRAVDAEVDPARLGQMCQALQQQLAVCVTSPGAVVDSALTAEDKYCADIYADTIPAVLVRSFSAQMRQLQYLQSKHTVLELLDAAVTFLTDGCFDCRQYDLMCLERIPPPVVQSGADGGEEAIRTDFLCASDAILHNVVGTDSSGSFSLDSISGSIIPAQLVAGIAVLRVVRSLCWSIAVGMPEEFRHHALLLTRLLEALESGSASASACSESVELLHRLCEAAVVWLQRAPDIDPRSSTSDSAAVASAGVAVGTASQEAAGAAGLVEEVAAAFVEANPPSVADAVTDLQVATVDAAASSAVLLVKFTRAEISDCLLSIKGLNTLSLSDAFVLVQNMFAAVNQSGVPSSRVAAALPLLADAIGVYAAKVRGGLGSRAEQERAARAASYFNEYSAFLQRVAVRRLNASELAVAACIQPSQLALWRPRSGVSVSLLSELEDAVHSGVFAGAESETEGEVTARSGPFAGPHRLQSLAELVPLVLLACKTAREFESLVGNRQRGALGGGASLLPGMAVGMGGASVHWGAFNEFEPECDSLDALLEHFRAIGSIQSIKQHRSAHAVVSVDLSHRADVSAALVAATATRVLSFRGVYCEYMRLLYCIQETLTAVAATHFHPAEAGVDNGTGSGRSVHTQSRFVCELATALAEPCSELRTLYGRLRGGAVPVHPNMTTIVTDMHMLLVLLDGVVGVGTAVDGTVGRSNEVRITQQYVLLLQSCLLCSYDHNWLEPVEEGASSVGTDYSADDRVVCKQIVQSLLHDVCGTGHGDGASSGVLEAAAVVQSLTLNKSGEYDSGNGADLSTAALVRYIGKLHPLCSDGTSLGECSVSVSGAVPGPDGDTEDAFVQAALLKYADVLRCLDGESAPGIGKPAACDEHATLRANVLKRALLLWNQYYVRAFVAAADTTNKGLEVSLLGLVLSQCSGQLPTAAVTEEREFASVVAYSKHLALLQTVKAQIAEAYSSKGDYRKDMRTPTAVRLSLRSVYFDAQVQSESAADRQLKLTMQRCYMYHCVQYLSRYMTHQLGAFVSSYGSSQVHSTQGTFLPSIPDEYGGREWFRSVLTLLSLATEDTEQQSEAARQQWERFVALLTQQEQAQYSGGDLPFVGATPLLRRFEQLLAVYDNLRDAVGTEDCFDRVGKLEAIHKGPWEEWAAALGTDSSSDSGEAPSALLDSVAVQELFDGVRERVSTAIIQGTILCCRSLLQVESVRIGKVCSTVHIGEGQGQMTAAGARAGVDFDSGAIQTAVAAVANHYTLLLEHLVWDPDKAMEPTSTLQDSSHSEYIPAVISIQQWIYRFILLQYIGVALDAGYWFDVDEIHTISCTNSSEGMGMGGANKDSLLGAISVLPCYSLFYNSIVFLHANTHYSDCESDAVTVVQCKSNTVTTLPGYSVLSCIRIWHSKLIKNAMNNALLNRVVDSFDNKKVSTTTIQNQSPYVGLGSSIIRETTTLLLDQLIQEQIRRAGEEATTKAITKYATSLLELRGDGVGVVGAGAGVGVSVPDPMSEQDRALFGLMSTLATDALITTIPLRPSPGPSPATGSGGGRVHTVELTLAAVPRELVAASRLARSVAPLTRLLLCARAGRMCTAGAAQYPVGEEEEASHILPPEFRDVISAAQSRSVALVKAAQGIFWDEDGNQGCDDTPADVAADGGIVEAASVHTMLALYRQLQAQISAAAAGPDSVALTRVGVETLRANLDVCLVTGGATDSTATRTVYTPAGVGAAVPCSELVAAGAVATTVQTTSVLPKWFGFCQGLFQVQAFAHCRAVYLAKLEDTSERVRLSMLRTELEQTLSGCFEAYRGDAGAANLPLNGRSLALDTHHAYCDVLLQRQYSALHAFLVRMYSILGTDIYTCSEEPGDAPGLLAHVMSQQYRYRCDGIVVSLFLQALQNSQVFISEPASAAASKNGASVEYFDATTSPTEQNEAYIIDMHAPIDPSTPSAGAEAEAATGGPSHCYVSVNQLIVEYNKVLHCLPDYELAAAWSKLLQACIRYLQHCVCEQACLLQCDTALTYYYDCLRIGDASSSGGAALATAYEHRTPVMLNSRYMLITELSDECLVADQLLERYCPGGERVACSGGATSAAALFIHHRGSLVEDPSPTHIIATFMLWVRTLLRELIKSSTSSSEDTDDISVNSKALQPKDLVRVISVFEQNHRSLSAFRARLGALLAVDGAASTGTDADTEAEAATEAAADLTEGGADGSGGDSGNSAAGTVQLPDWCVVKGSYLCQYSRAIYRHNYFLHALEHELLRSSHVDVQGKAAGSGVDKGTGTGSSADDRHAQGSNAFFTGVDMDVVAMCLLNVRTNRRFGHGAAEAGSKEGRRAHGTHFGGRDGGSSRVSIDLTGPMVLSAELEALVQLAQYITKLRTAVDAELWIDSGHGHGAGEGVGEDAAEAVDTDTAAGIEADGYAVRKATGGSGGQRRKSIMEAIRSRTAPTKRTGKHGKRGQLQSPPASSVSSPICADSAPTLATSATAGATVGSILDYERPTHFTCSGYIRQELQMIERRYNNILIEHLLVHALTRGNRYTAHYHIRNEGQPRVNIGGLYNGEPQDGVSEHVDVVELQEALHIANSHREYGTQRLQKLYHSASVIYNLRQALRARSWEMVNSCIINDVYNSDPNSALAQGSGAGSTGTSGVVVMPAVATLPRGSIAVGTGAGAGGGKKTRRVSLFTPGGAKPRASVKPAAAPIATTQSQSQDGAGPSVGAEGAEPSFFNQWYSDDVDPTSLTATTPASLHLTKVLTDGYVSEARDEIRGVMRLYIRNRQLVGKCVEAMSVNTIGGCPAELDVENVHLSRLVATLRLCTGSSRSGESGHIGSACSTIAATFDGQSALESCEIRDEDMEDEEAESGSADDGSGSVGINDDSCICDTSLLLLPLLTDADYSVLNMVERLRSVRAQILQMYGASTAAHSMGADPAAAESEYTAKTALISAAINGTQYKEIVGLHSANGVIIRAELLLIKAAMEYATRIKKLQVYLHPPYCYRRARLAVDHIAMGGSIGTGTRSTASNMAVREISDICESTNLGQVGCCSRFYLRNCQWLAALRLAIVSSGSSGSGSAGIRNSISSASSAATSSRWCVEEVLEALLHTLREGGLGGHSVSLGAEVAVLQEVFGCAHVHANQLHHHRQRAHHVRSADSVGASATVARESGPTPHAHGVHHHQHQAVTKRRASYASIVNSCSNHPVLGQDTLAHAFATDSGSTGATTESGVAPVEFDVDLPKVAFADIPPCEYRDTGSTVHLSACLTDKKLNPTSIPYMLSHPPTTVGDLPAYHPAYPGTFEQSGQRVVLRDTLPEIVDIRNELYDRVAILVLHKALYYQHISRAGGGVGAGFSPRASPTKQIGGGRGVGMGAHLTVDLDFLDSVTITEAILVINHLGCCHQSPDSDDVAGNVGTGSRHGHGTGNIVVTSLYYTSLFIRELRHLTRLAHEHFYSSSIAPEEESFLRGVTDNSIARRLVHCISSHINDLTARGLWLVVTDHSSNSTSSSVTNLEIEDAYKLACCISVRSKIYQLFYEPPPPPQPLPVVVVAPKPVVAPTLVTGAATPIVPVKRSRLQSFYRAAPVAATTPPPLPNATGDTNVADVTTAKGVKASLPEKTEGKVFTAPAVPLQSGARQVDVVQLRAILSEAVLLLSAAGVEVSSIADVMDADIEYSEYVDPSPENEIAFRSACLYNSVHQCAQVVACVHFLHSARVSGVLEKIDSAIAASETYARRLAIKQALLLSRLEGTRDKSLRPQNLVFLLHVRETLAARLRREITRLGSYRHEFCGHLIAAEAETPSSIAEASRSRNGSSRSSPAVVTKTKLNPNSPGSATVDMDVRALVAEFGREQDPLTVSEHLLGIRRLLETATHPPSSATVSASAADAGLNVVRLRVGGGLHNRLAQALAALRSALLVSSAPNSTPGVIAATASVSWDGATSVEEKAQPGTKTDMTVHTLYYTVCILLNALFVYTEGTVTTTCLARAPVYRARSKFSGHSTNGVVVKTITGNPQPTVRQQPERQRSHDMLIIPLQVSLRYLFVFVCSFVCVL